ncbi:MAG TPA: MFS transporter [Paenalcaligenes hominis]|uniref:MFS transporter n=1 Tax=Paenalcaligenes hominis TaxID=643674 RepID=A0A9D2VEA6_9BURK|nr:MFS transporter [Paenalcaligenes hominis]
MSSSKNQEMSKKIAKRVQFTPQERRSSVLLAILFSTRMLGLFLLTPIFAVAAQSIPGGNNAMKVGVALGAYGLTQAIMQIPLGMASDRFGRRPVIVAGMVLFIIGGVVSALAQSVDGIIVGRVLQGLGAISAAITAWVADATRPEVRTRAMAMVGSAIGLSFAVSLVLSPVLVGQFGLSGLFWAISLLGFVCLLIAAFGIAEYPKSESLVQVSAREVLGHSDLLRLNLGVFALHFILMTLFVVIPTTLSEVGQLDSGSLWKVYLPVIVLSFGFMIPMVIRTEVRKTHTKTLTHLVFALALVMTVMPWASQSFWGVVVCLFLFFCLFNTLEALQPSLVSRVAPANYKGLAMGFYNTTQSLGVFGGGLAGGVIASTAGMQWALWLGAALALVWWGSTRRFTVQL